MLTCRNHLHQKQSIPFKFYVSPSLAMAFSRSSMGMRARPVHIFGGARGGVHGTHGRRPARYPRRDLRAFEGAQADRIGYSVMKMALVTPNASRPG